MMSHPLSRVALVGVIALSFVGSLHAVPIIPGFERFGRSGDSPAPVGELLLAELNCTACHTSGAVAPKQGPVLDKVGERVQATYLRKFLRDPHQTKPGTTMPDLFS